MTISELYEQLADKAFSDHSTGNLFFPAYMYVYNPEKEYEMEKEIVSLQERLYRPTNYLHVMVLDIFQEFSNFLKSERFGKHNKFDFFLEREPSMPEQVNTSLKHLANDDRFFDWVNKRIEEHFENAGESEVAYVFVKGFGAIFPYLRVSKFMNNFERYLSGNKYKLIIFYPGSADTFYSMFNLLGDENLYRAIKLINK